MWDSGERDWPNMTKWKELPGHGRALTAPSSRLHSHRKPSVRIRRIGEKNGSKRSVLVDGRGIPLSNVVAGANRHDVKLLERTLDEIVIERPPPTNPPKENLCADKAYVGQPAQDAMAKRRYMPHVPRKGKEMDKQQKKPGARPRRWVVERTHSWLNRFRKLLTRFEKTTLSFNGLLELACALIVFRCVIVIYG